jgi:hypothetical protein
MRIHDVTSGSARPELPRSSAAQIDRRLEHPRQRLAVLDEEGTATLFNGKGLEPRARRHLPETRRSSR